jgi:hypothetical protein
MFSNNGARIRRLTAIILAIMSVCMVMPVQAETAAVDTLFGEVKNETYENGFLGLGCTLEGWHYYTDEELEKVNQRTKEALSNALDDLVDRNIGIMMAEGPDGKQNVNIQLQNVKNYTAIYKMMGLEYVATNSLDGFKVTLGAAGFTDIQVCVDEVTVGEQNFTCVKGEYKIRDIQVYFKQLWEIQDNYLVTVTVTAFIEDTTDEVFSKFFLL